MSLYGQQRPSPDAAGAAFGRPPGQGVPHPAGPGFTQPAGNAALGDTQTIQLPAQPYGYPATPTQPIDHRPGPPAAAASGPAAEGRRTRRLLIVGGIVAVLLLAVGGTAAYGYAGDIPRGVTVLGVDLGGMSRSEATATVNRQVAARAAELAAPVPVVVGDKTVQVTPADVGLAVDVAATVTAAARHSPGPFERLFGSRTVDPAITVDAARLDEVLRETAGTIGTAMTMPAVVFEGTTPKAVYPKAGKGLDQRRSADALRSGWPGGQAVTVPLVDLNPATTAAEVDKLIAELATPAVSGPVTVTTERGNLTVPPAAIAKSLVLSADRTGRIQPRVDTRKLGAALATALRKVEVEPKEATVALAGGKPQVVASTGGTRLDLAALGRDLLPVLPRTDDRQVAGKLTAVAPKTSTGEMTELGIKERVSTFTTTFTGGLSLPRSHNIVQIAKEVDGAVVKPGETFSLNGHTGERSYQQGYQDAPVIVGGKLVPGVGGGASQFTTTLFNATYYAGLEDVEHKPHSYWFSRYPSVIESTIFYPTLDMKFRNNTQYGVLLDTSWTKNSITVSVWSTKIYDSVKTQWSPRRNITSPRTIYLDPGPNCIPTDGINGFTQDAWRIIRKDGKEVKREKFTWRYDPEPRYLCAKKPE